MEDYSWKFIILAAGACIVLLFFTYFLVTSKTMDFLNIGPPEHIIEFQGNHVIGRKGEKKDWEVIARAGWSTKNQEKTQLEKIENAWVYEDNVPVMKNISAETVTVHKKSEIVEMLGAPLKAEIDLLRASTSKKSKAKYAKLFAQRIRYDGKAKISEVFDDIKIIDGRTVVYADRMEIDHNTKLAKIQKKPRAYKGSLSIYCDEILANPKDEEYTASGNLKMHLVEKKEKTKITAKEAIITKKENEIVEINDDVQIVQAHKAVVADHAVYYDQKNELKVTGQTSTSVQAVFEKAEEILTKDTIKKISNEEARELLKEKTVLTCAEMTIYTHTDDALASGNVYITQKDNEAKSDQALYKDTEEKIYMTGNVSMKKDNKWIGAKQVIVSIQNESFEAVGDVQTKFILKKTSTPTAENQ